MVLPTVTSLAAAAGVVVAALAAAMAWLGLRSYRATGNQRLIFVVVAFVVFVLKSLFTAYNVVTHAVPHDAIELVGALFDVVVLLLLFIPFLVPTTR